MVLIIRLPFCDRTIPEIVSSCRSGRYGYSMCAELVIIVSNSASCVAGCHSVPEINHNDDYEWYYSSLRVIDADQPFYRSSTSQLTPGDVDVKPARCCSRRPDDASGLTSIVAGSTEPCECLSFLHLSSYQIS